MPEEEGNEEFSLNLCTLKLKKQTRFDAPSKVIANVERKKGAVMMPIVVLLRSKKKRYNEPGPRIYDHYLQQVLTNTENLFTIQHFLVISRPWFLKLQYASHYWYNQPLITCIDLNKNPNINSAGNVCTG